MSDSEKERLAELLDSDPTARQSFVEDVEWETRLAEVLRGDVDGRGELRGPDLAPSADATATMREWTATSKWLTIQSADFSINSRFLEDRSTFSSR